MIHKKKIIPQCFNDILTGSKRFDLRDRSDGYVIDETITYLEYDGNYTGREIDVKITYLSDYEQKEGNIIVGFEVSA